MKSKAPRTSAISADVTDVTDVTEVTTGRLAEQRPIPAVTEVPDASTMLARDYLKLTALGWSFYAALMEEAGFQWTSWAWKWSLDERLAQQITAPAPALSMATKYGQTAWEIGADMQGRWLDAWMRFLTWNPAAMLGGMTGTANVRAGS